MSAGGATAFAALSAALGATGAFVLLAPTTARLRSRLAATLERISRSFEEALGPLARAGLSGADPTRRERRRLRVAFGAGGLVLGSLVAGPLAGAVIALISARFASRVVRWRRERFARRLSDGAAPAALAIADALGTGHAPRAAIGIAGSGLDGPIGVELRRVAGELELGAATDAALARLRARAASRQIDLVVAALRLQRRSGGNLAALLRDLAQSLEEQARVAAQARAETAQARFTSTLVLAMPLFFIAFGELAAPGLVARVMRSPVGVSLAGMGLVLQLAGALLVRRLSRVAD